jgi:hypothetical protein
LKWERDAERGRDGMKEEEDEGGGAGAGITVVTAWEKF